MPFVLDAPALAGRVSTQKLQPLLEEEEIETGNPPPREIREKSDGSNSKKTLFVCASTVERCEDIIAYINAALDIDDVREQVQVVVSQESEELGSSLLRVVTQGVRNNVGICLRLDEMDIDAYFLSLCSIAVKLLSSGENKNIYDARNLLQGIVTFGAEGDVVERVQGVTKFQDAFLDFAHAHRESANDLLGIFALDYLIDLFNPQKYPFVRVLIGARIRGEI